MIISDEEFFTQYSELTNSQKEITQQVVSSFRVPHTSWRNENSDLISTVVLDNFCNRLLIHHATSRQPLSKDRFEFALEATLQESGAIAHLVKSRTNRGHDITVNDVPISLKTEAAAGIRDDLIHVSKWMELGRGEWILTSLLSLFLSHMESYSRIFTLRCFSRDSRIYKYELVEIPKSLLLESSKCELVICEDSRQSPKPGYGNVYDEDHNLKFSLYFDGGSERKLQIRHLRKSLCVVHATWQIALPTT